MIGYFIGLVTGIVIAGTVYAFWPRIEAAVRAIREHRNKSILLSISNRDAKGRFVSKRTTVNAALAAGRAAREMKANR